MDEDFSCLFDATELDGEALEKSRKVSFSARGNLTPPCTRERHKTQTRTRPRKKRDRKRRSQVFWRRKRERDKHQTRRRLLQKRIQEKSEGKTFFSVRRRWASSSGCLPDDSLFWKLKPSCFRLSFRKKSRESGNFRSSSLAKKSDLKSRHFCGSHARGKCSRSPPSLYGEKQSRKEPLLGDTHT